MHTESDSSGDVYVPGVFKSSPCNFDPATVDSIYSSHGGNDICGNDIYGSGDAYFCSIATSLGLNNSSVPTLSGWAILLLAGGLAAIAVRQRFANSGEYCD